MHDRKLRRRQAGKNIKQLCQKGSRDMRLLFQQALMISVGILMAIGVDALIDRAGGQQELIMPWYTPFAIVFTGILCALPTFLFSSEKAYVKAAFYVRVFLHFLLLFGIVSLAGALFEWYHTIAGYLGMMASFLVIYLLVWLGSLVMVRLDEIYINAKLEQIRDDE